MTEIGTEVVHKLRIVPAYYIYACKRCGETADEGCETPVVKAPP